MKLKRTIAIACAVISMFSTAYAAEFLYGADITQLNFVEDMGGKYYDFDKTEKDAVQILAENGVNAVRIRLSNTTGKGTGDGTYYLPDGYQDFEDCLDLAKRAKEHGMAIQWTFNYSDYWPNGERQIIPSQWADQIKTELGFDINNSDFLRQMSDSERKSIQTMLGDLVYEYTKDILTRLKQEGITPEFVSFGNEMQAGLFFPFCNFYQANYSPDKKQLVFGDDKSDNDVICPQDREALVSVLNRAYDAVKEVDDSILTVLHSDGGGIMSKYDYFIGGIIEAGAKFDIIGASYYPAWSQVDVDTLTSFIDEVCEKYDKDILIMETGYNWNPTRKDGYDGQLVEFEGYMEKFPFTPQGQAGYLNELITGLKTVKNGRCLGFLYWDPMLIHVEDENGINKTGWAVREEDDMIDANVVENSTLFDFDGNALPALQIIKAHSQNGIYLNPHYEDGILTNMSISKTLTGDSKYYYGAGTVREVSQPDFKP